MYYKDFIIKIESKRDQDYIISIESPAGEGNSTLTLPFDLEEAAGLMQNLAGTFRSSSAESVAEPSTREVSITYENVSEPDALPKALFESLFTGKARTLFDQSIGMISGDGIGLRIKLQIDPSDADVAELASLPWELLYREETRDYLNLSRNTPLVRYLNVQRPSSPLAFTPPLRILVVMSNPQGVAQLDLAQERKLIEQSWATQKGVEVDFLENPASTKRLSNKLSEKEYHVLHYMGHGDFDRQSGQGVLLLEDDNDQMQLLDGQTLGSVILRDVKSLRLVFLNACNTAKSTKEKGQDPFAGVATALVMAGIPAVVAMQFPITDIAAVNFAGTFYPRLVAGFPVDAAVAEGRKAIRVANAETMEWATPVLFMRSPDGVLFDFEDKELGSAKDIAETTASAYEQTKDSAPDEKQGLSSAVKGFAAAVVLVICIAAAGFILMPSTKTVPDITIAEGFNVNQATKILSDAELTIASKNVTEPSVAPAGTVVRTQPPAGAEVEPGDEILLVVSNGTLQLDDLQGKNQDELTELFSELPVSIRRFESELSDNDEGSFIRSEPENGAVIPHGSEVVIYLAASGIEVPELIDIDQRSAVNQLQSAGLRYMIVPELDFDVPLGKVIKTVPSSGTSQIPREPVELHVSVKGGWVYLEQRVELGEYTNNGSAKTLRKAPRVANGNQNGVLSANEKVVVLEREGRWAKVHALL